MKLISFATLLALSAPAVPQVQPVSPPPRKARMEKHLGAWLLGLGGALAITAVALDLDYLTHCLFQGSSCRPGEEGASFAAFAAAPGAFIAGALLLRDARLSVSFAPGPSGGQLTALLRF